jgi:energy-coupling factor transporter ATP-binding protein EcfA2
MYTSTYTPIKTTKIKSKFNWELYVKEFNSNIAKFCIILVGVLVLFSGPIASLFNTVFIQPLLQYCPKKNGFVDSVIITFFGWSILICIRHYRHRLRISINSWVIIFTICLTYVLFFRTNNYYEFYSFGVSCLNKIAYWDVFLVSTLLLIANYKSYLRPIKATGRTKLALIEDSPILKESNDIYERTAYAKHVASHITETYPENAFAIGIIGEWGSGKTQFLLRLKDILSDDENTIVVEFNSWRVGKPEAIIDEFFKTLSSKLKPYNRSVNVQLKEYSKKILQTGKEIQYRFIDTLIGGLLPDASIQEQYETLNESIKAIAKRIVILIDDMDRLTGKEVMEVLRIIRNTANFANTFFLVGIDQRYIVDVLKNTKDFTNEEEYLKKVFQLTITLPAFKKDVLLSELEKHLITEDLDDKNQQKLIDAIRKISKNFEDVSVPFFPAANHDNILEKLIDNVRDLKRFANSFKIAFNVLEDEVDIHDLMVLELIRNRNIEVYNAIRNKTLLGFKPHASFDYIIDDDKWAKFCDLQGKSLVETEKEGLKMALDYLVGDFGYKSPRNFHSIYNFYLYFSYQLFDLISLKEYRETLEKDSDAIIKQFNIWIDEQKHRELIAVSTRLVDFQTPDILLKMLIVYSNVNGNHNDWLIIMYKLIFELRKMNRTLYFKDDETRYKDFMKEIMGNPNILLFDRARIVKYFVEAYIKNDGTEQTLILKKIEWNEILYNLFKEHLQSLTKLDRLTTAFLGLNVVEYNSDNEPVIYEKAAQLFKETLLNKTQVFSDYVKIVLRSRLSIVLNKSSEINLCLFDKYLDQIFPDYEEFKKQLEKTELNDTDFKDAKSLVLKYIDRYFQNRQQAFTINDISDKAKLTRLLAKYRNLMVVDGFDEDAIESDEY